RRTGDRLTGDVEPLELERAAGDAAGVSPEPHRPAQRLVRQDRDQLPVVEHDPWTLIRPVPNEHRPRPEPQGARGTERNTDPGADRRPDTSLAERRHHQPSRLLREPVLPKRVDQPVRSGDRPRVEKVQPLILVLIEEAELQLELGTVAGDIHRPGPGKTLVD